MASKNIATGPAADPELINKRHGYDAPQTPDPKPATGPAADPELINKRHGYDAPQKIDEEESTGPNK